MLPSYSSYAGKISTFLAIVIDNKKKEISTSCVLEKYNNHQITDTFVVTFISFIENE